jgi:exonuclease VII large subunit
MEITIDQMDALFRENMVGMHTKLTGKTVVVAGQVSKVFIRDHIDVRYIVLTGSQKKMTWSARCSFAKENMTQMSRLNEGQSVKMRGKYDGYSKNILFKECVLAG